MNLILQEDQMAPSFSAMSQDGKKISLDDLKGQWVVLYFYPRDDTPGCTKEACGFRDSWEKIQETGAVVLGVSPDSVESHGKFARKFKLPFSLLADVDKKMVQDYGVWGEKKFMGRKYMGVHRTTFLINPQGKIQKIWREVKPAEHPAEVLAELQKV